MYGRARIALVSILVAASSVAFNAAAAHSRPARVYVVVYEAGAERAVARSEIRRAGGVVVEENRRLGVATVRSRAPRFAARAVRGPALLAAVRNRAIGRMPASADVGRREPIATFSPEDVPTMESRLVTEPLAGRQWDMRMVGATDDGSYERQLSNHGVRVAILDSGVDATHPDIAPNFDRELSRNFTTDMPDIDGPCEEEPDRSCTDPPDVDENGHGTHVAGIVAGALNGIGTAGVAPNAKLINLRVGQEGGFVFLQPVLDALTFAGDNGVDVANMSFSIDPWWWNCPANPADSSAAQAEQRAIVTATQRGLDYARARGVTLVASLGNFAVDMGRPARDELSPTYPPGSEYPRDIDNSCRMVPAESEGVVGVSSIGPSGRKSFMSNYGLEQTDVAAPGGDGRDRVLPAPTNRVLGPLPSAIGRIEEQNPALAPLIVKDERGNYWRYRHGTSMAAPHVTGVVALLVAEAGRRDPLKPGLKLSPNVVEPVLRSTAVELPCPSPPLLDYPEPETGPEFNALCEAAADRNGFYGHGVVSATGVLDGLRGPRR